MDEVRGDIFEQDDLASFYVFKDLGTQETLPLRYWAAAKAPYTRAEDGVIEPGPLRKLCIFKDGRRYFAVSASFYPYETIRKHQLSTRGQPRRLGRNRSGGERCVGSKRVG